MTDERDALEAAIDAAPDDAARYAVLGDSLLQTGELRGELISLQLRPAHTPREEWLLATDELGLPAPLRGQWRWGYVHTLFFNLVQYTHWEERRDDWTTTLLGPALAHPSCRFLRELVIDASPGDEALEFLSAHPPRVLDALSMTTNELQLARFGAGLSRLSRLHLYAQLIVPARVELPLLNELSLPVDAMTVDGLGVLLRALPSLTVLTLSSLETFDREAVFPATQVHGLESLTLRADNTTNSAVEAIVDSPLRDTLRTLDVSKSGMTAEAAHQLLAATPKFARLDSLLLGNGV